MESKELLNLTQVIGILARNAEQTFDILGGGTRQNSEWVDATKQAEKTVDWSHVAIGLHRLIRYGFKGGYDQQVNRFCVKHEGKQHYLKQIRNSPEKVLNDIKNGYAVQI